MLKGISNMKRVIANLPNDDPRVKQMDWRMTAFIEMCDDHSANGEGCYESHKKLVSRLERAMPGFDVEYAEVDADEKDKDDFEIGDYDFGGEKNIAYRDLSNNEQYLFRTLYHREGSKNLSFDLMENVKRITKNKQ
jgi:hypothetical protein